ncbi:MAG: hypothetical protein E7588_00020 [Ruminococcaceae bacterium]|nr:hypothetical protein [Oscillospiraceae bacterium]
MKRKITVDPFLAKQPPKLFIDELKKPMHNQKPEYFNKRTIKNGEVCVNGIYLVTEFEDELLETCYDDFRNFCKVYEIEGDKYPIITRKGLTSVYEEYKIVTDSEKTVVIAADTEGIRRGVIYLEDEMRRREGAFLPEGEIVRTPWLTSRITRCFFSPTNRPPKNGEELADDIDYYPDEYLNRLAHDGSNGVWIYTRFADLLPSKIITEYGKDYKRRIDKLNRTIAKCRRYGIKVFVFAIEPVPTRGELFEKYSDIRGNRAYDGYTFCTASERGKAYCEEATRTMFELCPDLGGYISITNGERTTNCTSGYQYIKQHMNACPNCRDKRAGEILAQAVDALREGIRNSKPEAEFLSWTYAHRGWDYEDIEEYVKLAPSDVCLVQNLEDNGVNEQLGKGRMAMDYWLSYVGPSEMFKVTARAAQKYGKRCLAKIQACCSHEVASVPYVPVPGILYDKYKAMYELGVSGVMQCWYFGNYPSMMNKVAGELAFWNDFCDKQAFIEYIAGIYWGESRVKEVAEAWNFFEKGYINYPTTIMFSYYGPMHDGPVWLLQLKPKNFPLSRSWIYGDPMDGDRIYECTLRGHTLEEAMILSKRMSESWKKGNKLMQALTDGAYDEFEQKSVSDALDCQFESGAEILEFYLLRDKLGTGEGDPNDILDRMEEIVKNEIKISRRLSKLSSGDGRLGYHSEAEGFRYFPEKLDDRADWLETLLATEFKEVRERIKNNLSPLEYYDGIEEGIDHYKIGSGWSSFASGDAQVKIEENENELIVEFRSKHNETLIISPEFRLFSPDVPMHVNPNGAKSIPMSVWMYFSMFMDECRAEMDKYSTVKLPADADFGGTHLEIHLDKSKFYKSDRPMKMAFQTDRGDRWRQREDQTVYLGKYCIIPSTYVWIER